MVTIDKIFIFDQYYDKIKEFNLNLFLKEIKDYQSFRIIISTSIDHDFANDGINNSLNSQKDRDFKMNFYPNLLYEKTDSILLLEDETN